MVACLVNRAITVSSDQTARDAELKRIHKIMEANGYPRKFVERNIKKQLKCLRKKTAHAPEEEKMITINIPFINGLSEEVRRVARMAGIRCTFYTPHTLKSLYSVKDALPSDRTTHVVYSVHCDTCDEEYIGETLRALGVRKKEHQDAIRLGQDKKSAIAEHIQDQVTPHEMDWASLKVIDQARKTKERKIREAFHIEQRMPKINRDKGVERSATWNAIL